MCTVCDLRDKITKILLEEAEGPQEAVKILVNVIGVILAYCEEELPPDAELAKALAGDILGLTKFYRDLREETQQ